MIGYIKGTIEEIGEDHVIIDNNGIGYIVYVPSAERTGLLHIAEETKLYIYMSVREDGITLFGFFNRDDLEAYKKLITVSGVGPKAAMAILSYMDAQTLRLAILTEDAAKIAKAQGIGKKTAAKIILELKDKFSIDDIFDTPGDDNVSTVNDNPGIADAAAALTALGYSGTESYKAVQQAAGETGSTDTEVLLKAALKHLF